MPVRGAGIPGSGAVGPAIVRKPSLFCEGFSSSTLRHLATQLVPACDVAGLFHGTNLFCEWISSSVWDT
jgi:hypothetical protein